ncbi:MAG: poly(A) polymerase [Legionellaceae bacterium]|nr:poly(A) polymerase [Legionellaceae bacterium]HAF87972.1 polynucleotide adenylyltransferase PcnB [Legionellales bacterium]
MQRTKKKPRIAAAHIIPRAKHTLSKTNISPNALKVLNCLINAGFEAYLVGGSVRDLLIGQSPKDFDVATNATPNQIKHLFRNARIIGRRFKLVHVVFYRDVIEVATFRGEQKQTTNQSLNDKGMLVRDNEYGTLEEDAWRRDFSINSLYYDIHDGSIVDFTGGLNDIEHRVIRMIGKPEKRYQEDPVRMLRAIRFSAKLNFSLHPDTASPIKTSQSLLRYVPSSRLFDEVTKLYQCGMAQKVHTLMLEYGLFGELFPATAKTYQSAYPTHQFLEVALNNTDSRLAQNKPITPAFLFAVFLWFPLLERAAYLKKHTPLQPLPALEQAMTDILLTQNKIVAIPKRFTQVMREIWLLQFRFTRRLGTRAANLLEHPRFRAAYDFLALRALVQDADLELAQWWTLYQDASLEEQTMMVSLLEKAHAQKRKSKQSS